MDNSYVEPVTMREIFRAQGCDVDAIDRRRKVNKENIERQNAKSSGYGNKYHGTFSDERNTDIAIKAALWG